MSRQKASQKEADQSVESNQPAPKVNIRIRNEQVMHHHLFKGSISKMKKNISWKPGIPDIREVEHVHFFHSCNSFGMQQEHTQEVGGHFHKVDWSVNENGDLVAKCGPPLKRISKKGRDGHPQTKIVPVEWQNKVKEHDDDPDVIQDRHTHEMVYLGSDVLTQAKITEINKQAAAARAAKEKAQAPNPGTDEVGLIDNDR